MDNRTDEAIFPKIINNTIQFAKNHRYEFVTLDMLTLAILNEKEGEYWFLEEGIDIDIFKRFLLVHINENTPKRMGQSESPSFTVQIEALIAQIESLPEEHRTIQKILSLMSDINIDNLTLTGQVLSYKNKISQQKAEQERSKNIKYIEQPKVPLNYFLPKSRQDVIISIVNTIKQKTSSNVILVGESGVGKSYLIKALSNYIETNLNEHEIKKLNILMIDLHKLISNSKYRGDIEEHFSTILKNLNKSGLSVLVIDDIHLLLKLADGNNSSLSGAATIKKIVEMNEGQKEFIILGTTTHKEYRSTFEADPSLNRQFTKILIEEPTRAEVLEILMHEKNLEGWAYKVNYSTDALEKIVDISLAQTNSETALPFRAINLMDKVGVNAGKLNKETITSTSLTDIFPQVFIGLLFNQVNLDKSANNIQNWQQTMQDSIIGQDSQIAILMDKLSVMLSGIIDKEGPLGSFLFAGPSGVGKTETARVLSKLLGIEVLRLDMSEYMESHSVSKLIGAPSGYIGYEDGGKLVNAINKNPNMLILFDEIEKAHPDVLNILLQILDYSILTDGRGKKCSFKNCIIIMTTNIGGGEIHKPSFGFTLQQQNNTKDRDFLIKKQFRPEFLGRIETIIHFDPIKKEAIKKIITLKLEKLAASILSRSGTTTAFEDKVVEHIVQFGFESKFGVRSVNNYIERMVAPKLLQYIFSNKIDKKNESLYIYVQNDQINITYKAIEALNVHGCKKQATKSLITNIT